MAEALHLLQEVRVHRSCRRARLEIVAALVVWYEVANEDYGMSRGPPFLHCRLIDAPDQL